jgi:protein SCO1/2
MVKILKRYGIVMSAKNLKRGCYLLFLLFLIRDPMVYAQAVLNSSADLKKIDVQEHPGDTLALGLTFIDENNRTVRLKDYFKSGRPVALTLAYYECPMLCTFVLNGLSKAVNAQSLVPGRDFNMLTISIDPREKPELAGAKEKNYRGGLTKKAGDSCWTFLVGQQPNISTLARQLGFIYYYDQARKQYAHPAVVFILSGDGVISRYLYGIDYKPQDLRLGLLEAGQGKIGNTIDRIILYCYHYDPDSKGYVVFAGNVMRLGGIATVLLLAVTLIIFWRKELYKRAGRVSIEAASKTGTGEP